MTLAETYAAIRSAPPRDPFTTLPTDLDGAMTQPTVLYYNLRAHPSEYLPALRAARDLGLRVVLVTSRAGFPAPAGLVAEVHVMKEPGGPAAVAQGLEIARATGATGVMTWSDTDVVTVSTICAELGLPAPSVQAATLTRNKWLGRQALAAVDPACVPRFRLVEGPDDLAAAIAELGPGGVLKPASGAGSAGVERIARVEQALSVMGRLLGFASPATHPLFLDGPGQLVYEEFLPGTEHSVEGFVHLGATRVVAITDKRTDPANFLEIEHRQPTALSRAEQRAVTNLAAEVVRAFGLDNCSFHLECKVDEGMARLVEIAARIGGGHITSHLVPLVTGENFYRNALLLAAGAAPEPASDPTGRYAAVVKVVAPAAGVFGGFPRLEALHELAGIEAVAVHRRVGDTVLVPPDDYAGALLASVVVSVDAPDDLAPLVDEVRTLLRPRMTGTEIPAAG
ncbi:ATP-grasp domain-containing protein [Micromonospora phytophila]|uniref:ATP-grasp domain-containing protein n=1 Tax=Micromonospora phytophila TaxID=709888 RepID=UPI00202DF9C2|nr:ATP-grasp domain-containing protein [Micromonospora phytophila]MCM0673465.1 ATP-grasp domain-containing protein [Micromonospora phytophila]